MASAADIEPNGSFATASDLGTGEIDFNGSLSLLDQVDSFKWTSVSGGLFDVDLLFIDALSDLDLELLDIGQGFVDSSRSNSDNEKVSGLAEPGQMFLIRVSSFDSRANTYTLQISGPGTETSPDTPPVPLPAGLPLLLAGLGGMALLRRKAG